MRPSRQLCLFFVHVGLVLSGCGGVRTVRGEVVHPAVVPIRSFPRVWVVGGDTVRERSFASGLAQHLSNGADVEVVELAILEPARVAGRIPPATAVVLPKLELRQGSITRWTSRPETVCGSAGCFQRRRSYQYEVPTLHAWVTLSVYDGPTATILQEVKIGTVEEGREYDDMEHRAVVTLVQRVGRMVDQRVESVDVPLLEVDVPAVSRALELVSAGDWTAGRRALEAVAADASRMSTLPVEMRARVLYDLGITRLYDRSTLGDPEPHFAAAKEALEEAIAIDPEARYRHALDEVEVHRQRFEAVQRQDEAAEHNFRLGEGIPEPPAAYQRRPEPGPAPPTPSD